MSRVQVNPAFPLFLDDFQGRARLGDFPPTGPNILFDKTPAAADLIVIDEASMLDLHLATRLCSAVPSGSHLLLVGDQDQLPSIAPAPDSPGRPR
ncbi:hypothetical protein Misp02_66000 [Microtetraspora sp. NBRC 16547]|nr:hypothetical protein Misp02_66000 [Microtetraspora sp. NBRC 16547]